MPDTSAKISQLRKRARAIQAIRDFFVKKNFLEVDTPLFLANPDPEPTIHLFEIVWEFEGEKRQGYLAPSPEFQMKKLLAAGSGSIFQICKSFRNQEPSSRLHNPEFTMLEWYRPNADYRQLMQDCEDLVVATWDAIDPGHSTALTYQKQEISLAQPWERLSVLEAFERYAGISEEVFFNSSAFRQAAIDKGYATTEDTSFNDVFYQIMLNEIEPHLGLSRPTFLYDYPLSQAALARIKPDDSRLAERFELYIGNLEIANAFSELVDWQEQQARLEQQLEERREKDQPAWEVDDQFISALREGLPATAGIALGVDRLIMLLTNASELSEVVSYTAAEIFSHRVV